MATILFTTCNQWPQLYQSDLLVATALTGLGHSVSAVRWQADFAHFQQADLIVLRAHWDYHHELPGFKHWLDQVEAAGIPVQNPPALVRWNLQKDYLFELEATGVKLPTTALLAVDATPQAIYQQYGWTQAIIKPAIGASGHLVEKVAYTDLATWQAQVRPKRAAGAWLIQEFRPEIAQGELSLIFINGHFSHAVNKQPGAGEYRIDTEAGGQISRIQPPAAVIEQAHAPLTHLPAQPLYARVDGVVTATGDFCLIELEINEPWLYFEYAPEQAVRFAEAIHDKVVG